MTTFIVVGMVFGAFLAGTIAGLCAGKHVKSQKTVGTLVVDMVDPYDPSLYLTMESYDDLYELIDKHVETAVFDINVRRD